MNAFLYVFIGGGSGACLRYLISKVLPNDGASFPIATFIANLISCIILGALMAFLLKKGMNEKTQLLLMTGFCGGFSTFSTFSAESFKLLENNQIALCMSYIGLSVILCITVLFLSYYLFSKAL